MQSIFIALRTKDFLLFKQLGFVFLFNWIPTRQKKTNKIATRLQSLLSSTFLYSLWILDQMSGHQSGLPKNRKMHACEVLHSTAQPLTFITIKKLFYCCRRGSSTERTSHAAFYGNVWSVSANHQCSRHFVFIIHYTLPHHCECNH